MIENINYVHQDIYNDEKWREWARTVDAFTTKDNPEFGRDLGIMHWFNVSGVATDIVAGVGGNEHDIVLADIAGLLCGIGLVNGFADYPDSSAKMAYGYLTGRYYSNHVMSGQDIDLICHAIANHVSGEEIQNVIDAALCIADKVDIGANRIKDSVTETQKAQANISRVNCFIAPDGDGMISINYNGNGSFKPYAFLKGWPEGYLVPHKAANFLNRPFALFLNEETLLWKPDAELGDDE